MHRYADLNRNRVSRLEGNLVVADRKRNKISKPKQDYQFGLWIVILVMFAISALYVRYQALYVEDSVFRDAYIVINEHFLSKERLPDLQNFSGTEGSSSIVQSDNQDSPNAINSLQNTSISGENILPAQPNIQTPPQTSPQLSQLNQKLPTDQGSYIATTPQGVNGVTPLPNVSPSPVNTENSSVGNIPLERSEMNASIPANSINSINSPNNPNPPNYGYRMENQDSIGNSQQAVISSQTETLPISKTPSFSTKHDIFSYYHPILNSKSTKVGFFLANKKTDYRSDKLYQVLFQELVTFRSSNPKIKNFFDPNTRLNNSWIENDTLILDFNTAFENSKYGYMGIEVKIQQVLWTFFNFQPDTINKISYISFLINGRRKDIIGGDGKILKPFYSRKDLRSVITL